MTLKGKLFCTWVATMGSGAVLHFAGYKFGELLLGVGWVQLFVFLAWAYLAG
jgi:hypothetical protein